MGKNEKRAAKEKANTRQLMGIKDITSYSLVTAHGELVFFMIKPTNISVLSDTSINARIYALMNVLKESEFLRYIQETITSRIL